MKESRTSSAQTPPGASSTESRGKTKAAGRDTVQSLSRALHLLNVVASSDQGLPLSDAARAAGLAVSTSHRLLTTLEQDKFVRFDRERGVWVIGVQAFIIGNAFPRARDLTAMARPVMRQLMEKSGETVNLAIEDQGYAVYVAQVECRKLMRAISRPGGRAAMHASGVGKALLAAMPDDEAEAIVKLRGLAKETSRTIDTLPKFRAELVAIRARGYAIDDEENTVGLRCAAAAIYDEHGSAFAAISLSGPAARMGDNVLAGLGEAVVDAAQRITAQYGGKRRVP